MTTVREKQELISQYHDQGYVVVRSCFSLEEVADWQRECDQLWALPENRDTNEFRVDLRDTTEGIRIPERLDPVTDASPVFSKLSRDERILSLAMDLLGDEARLFKDKLILKLPGTCGYRTHQDYAYVADFGFEGDRQLAVAIAIDSSDAENGAIEVFPGRHTEQLPAPADDDYLVDEASLDLSTGKLINMDPGDILIFHSLCPHRSSPNRTEESRRILYFTYTAASCGDFYEIYYRLGKP